ncbi:MAG: beta-phosphoglucomutase [Clostridia bacterium]|nr:beta-phosphoglucomutase [Clostridiales bacterium]MDD7165950.1 beta-phosphoglucomutase [Clostridia bacterium]MDY2900447.1 beta-phosphoglucomutase [Christensenellaceae bacterium]
MKAFIFDLDGVLVSTDKYHYQAWKKIADKEGIYFDEKINDRLRGVSRMDSLEIILERAEKQYTEEEKLALATEKNDLYRDLLKNLTPADRLAGVTETLEKLKEKGYLLAIGSSSRNTPVILSKIGYDGYFDAVSDGNNITKSKPDPEVFEKAAEMLSLPAKECFVVEDSLAGIDAAKAGGFKAIGIGGAAIYAKTDYPINAITDILKLI